MKTFITSGLLLLLLLLLLLTSWRCSGQEPVSVECNYLHLRVVAKRTLFYPDERVGPDELFLGTGCVVVRVGPDELEFNYPISLCGIVTEIVADGTIFYTWLTYKPKKSYFSAELQLQCVVRSSYAMKNQEMHLPAAQYWFLLQLRYCSFCGYAHLLDNWVRILQGSKLNMQTFTVYGQSKYLSGERPYTSLNRVLSRNKSYIVTVQIDERLQ